MNPSGASGKIHFQRLAASRTKVRFMLTRLSCQGFGMRLSDSENGNCYFHWNFCLCEKNASAGDSKTSGLLQSRFKGVLGHELWTGAGNPRENRICMEIAMRFRVSNSYVFRGLGGQSNKMGAYPHSSWENKDWI